MFDSRSCLGHDDGCRDLELAGRKSHALRMVSSGAADDTLPTLFRVKMSHLVVGTAQLEAEHGLGVLALEQYIALESVAEVDRVRELRLFACFVDSGRSTSDEPQVLQQELARSSSPMVNNSHEACESYDALHSQNVEGLDLRLGVHWATGTPGAQYP